MSDNEHTIRIPKPLFSITRDYMEEPSRDWRCDPEAWVMALQFDGETVFSQKYFYRSGYGNDLDGAHSEEDAREKFSVLVAEKMKRLFAL